MVYVGTGTATKRMICSPSDPPLKEATKKLERVTKQTCLYWESKIWTQQSKSVSLGRFGFPTVL